MYLILVFNVSHTLKHTKNKTNSLLIKKFLCFFITTPSTCLESLSSLHNPRLLSIFLARQDVQSWPRNSTVGWSSIYSRSIVLALLIMQRSRSSSFCSNPMKNGSGKCGGKLPKIYPVESSTYHGEQLVSGPSPSNLCPQTSGSSTRTRTVV